MRLQSVYAFGLCSNDRQTSREPRTDITTQSLINVSLLSIFEELKSNNHNPLLSTVKINPSEVDIHS